MTSSIAAPHLGVRELVLGRRIPFGACPAPVLIWRSPIVPSPLIFERILYAW